MVKKLHHTLSKISYYRTKNVPCHILAPAAVACDICIVRRSAHPRGAFLCNRNEISYYIKITSARKSHAEVIFVSKYF